MNPNQAPDNDFYKNGVRRMVDEGLELAGKIIHYMQTHGERLSQLDRAARKKAILAERDDFTTFAQVHPIVYEYLVVEQIFNRTAFKRYIQAAFGAPKSAEDQEFAAKDKRNVYYLKNKQYALYYKFLLQEMNPQASSSSITTMHEDMVRELNASTKEMLDRYEEVQKKVEIQNDRLSAEKRSELAQLLKNRLEIDAQLSG
jgi:hypothetical protein